MSKRRLPPLNALRVFEVAAEAGLSFDRIAAAAEGFGRLDDRLVLRVSAPTSFAMRWPIPRLDGFHGQHPRVAVTVTTVTSVHDALRGGFDVAVRRGRAEPGAWPGFRTTPVLDEEDTVVLAPALQARRPVGAPADVEGHARLGSETRPGDWVDWLEAAGLPHLAGTRRQVFDHVFVTRQAVEDGLGLDIGPLPLLDFDLASGRLVAPLPEVRVRRTGYVALVPLGAGEPAADRFAAWLAAEGCPNPRPVTSRVEPSSAGVIQ